MRISPLTPHLLAICLTAFLPRLGLSADVSATWLNGDGAWSDETQWSTDPSEPNYRHGITYDATINSGNVTLDHDITIQRLFLNGGNIGGSSQLTLNDGLSLTGGSLFGVTLNLGAGSSSTIAANFITFQGIATINNSGTVNQTAFIGGTFNAPRINNLAGGVWNIHNANGFSVILNNAGTVVADRDLFFTDTAVKNSGTITVNGVLDLRMGSGPNIASGTFNVAEMHFRDTGYTLTTGATINAGLVQTSETELDIAGNTTINSNLELLNSVLLVQAGATLTFTGALVDDTLGSVHLNGGAIANSQTLHFEHGRLSGSGTINGDVEHNATISPGGTQPQFFPASYVNSPGALSIDGNLSLLTDAKLVMEIGGFKRGTQRDYLAISGMVTLNGTLVLQMINGFQMQLNGGEVFTLLTSGDIIGGAFTNVANGERLVTQDGSASFQVNYGTGSLFDPDDLVLSDPEIVPEPASFLLLVVGAAFIGLVRFRRQQVCRSIALSNSCDRTANQLVGSRRMC